MRAVPLLAALLLAAPAMAQDTAPRASDPDAPRAVSGSTPTNQRADKSLANETGLKKRVVTPMLESSLNAPYGRQGTGSCAEIGRSIAAIDRELGPDVDQRDMKKGGSDARYYAERTGQFLLSPVFLARDIFTEASGNRKARDRFSRAVEAATARRGFLKGLAAGRGCPVYKTRTAG